MRPQRYNKNCIYANFSAKKGENVKKTYVFLYISKISCNFAGRLVFREFDSPQNGQNKRTFKLTQIN